MKNLLIIIITIFIVNSNSIAQFVQINSNYLNQTGFIENIGQLEVNIEDNMDKIFYYYESKSLNIYFFKDKVSFVIRKNYISDEKLLFYKKNQFEDTLCRIDLIFINPSTNAKLTSSLKLSSTINYYQNKNKFMNIKSWKRLIYEKIYDGIDLVFDLNKNKLDIKFQIKNLNNLENIKIRFNGCESIDIAESGELNLVTKLGSTSLDFYNSKRDFVNFHLDKQNNLFLKLNNKNGDMITNNYELGWSTYVGGTSVDVIRALTYDDDNNIYAVGFSQSNNFPITPGAIQKIQAGSGDVVIMKLTQNGNLIWSTYLGGYGSDGGTSIVFSSRKKLMISGETRSGNFPITQNAFQKNYAGGTSDAFFSVLSTNGELEYSTFFGSSAYDVFGTIKEDSFGNIWLFGNTPGRDFPTTMNAYQNINKGYYDAVLVKFDSNYNLVFSTYFGAEHDDFGHFITIDNNNNIIITGYTSSHYLPTNNNSYKINLSGNNDCYLAKFDNLGNLIWCSYFGGSQEDVSSNIITDDQNSIYLRGVTNSSDLPVTSNAFQKKIGGQSDVFIAKFAQDCDLLWCSYYGGNQDDGPLGFDLHGGGLDINKSKTKLIMSGRTKSNNLFVTEEAFQKSFNGGIDAFVFEFDLNCIPIWSTYLGGTSDDIGYWASYDKNENKVVAGTTLSSNFPNKNPQFQYNYNGNYEGFITKFGKDIPILKDSCFSVLDYPNFLYAKDLVIVGNAFKKDSIIRLTDTRSNQAGAVWHSKKVNVADGFSTKFAFKFSEGYNNQCNDNSLPGADGIAFIIQNVSNMSFGWSGGGLGYDGISNSLALEFDTFNNDSTQIENLFDPNGNHIAVQSCGESTNTAKHIKDCNLAMNSNIFPLRSDGTKYYVKIDYKIGNNKFIVYLDSLPLYRNKVIELDNFDISKILKLDQNKFAYVGFTAATGCAVENHDLLSWDLCTMTKTISDVPFDDSEVTDLSFDIIPNPVQNEINIKFYYIGNELIELELYNLLGQKIYQENIFVLPQQPYKIKFDVNNLPTGFYFCKVSNSKQSVVKKFILSE